VEGGPPFTAARTHLEVGSVVREGNRITLEAIEYTEVAYVTPAGERAMTQQVRRRFEFAAEGGRITLVGEHVVDPDASPINDPDEPPPSRSVPAPAPPSVSPSPSTPPASPSAPSPAPPRPSPTIGVTQLSP
jgi:hypothetical protein